MPLSEGGPHKRGAKEGHPLKSTDMLLSEQARGDVLFSVINIHDFKWP